MKKLQRIRGHSGFMANVSMVQGNNLAHDENKRSVQAKMTAAGYSFFSTSTVDTTNA